MEEHRVAKGRLKYNASFGRPGGTYGNLDHLPALKRRAIFKMSLWDLALAFVPKWRCAQTFLRGLISSDKSKVNCV